MGKYFKFDSNGNLLEERDDYTPEPEPTDPPIDDITALQLAVVELAETQESYQASNELALAELAELMLGGI